MRLIGAGRKRNARLDAMKELMAAKATRSESSGLMPSVPTARDASAF